MVLHHSPPSVSVSILCAQLGSIWLPLLVLGDVFFHKSENKTKINSGKKLPSIAKLQW